VPVCSCDSTGRWDRLWLANVGSGSVRWPANEKVRCLWNASLFLSFIFFVFISLNVCCFAVADCFLLMHQFVTGLSCQSLDESWKWQLSYKYCNKHFATLLSGVATCEQTVCYAVYLNWLIHWEFVVLCAVDQQAGIPCTFHSTSPMHTVRRATW